ncbi:helix-turn-helix domain-containing protein [Polynucleobacter sp. AP-Nino-20-G2]|uniref:helix-turn-helix domain-containing protein n=1 Tax=Polynucleobacter sp. AP-Nino-20-G2 TaxID=2576917 RepID=UPI001BFDF5ED|nr:helix-turn-helix domain-containing protein [Polynucleobacter sp. AP-Nino-20-G2]QWE16174.1 helix-turn-helix domain-containing protein [Polynucleobacter sp. AP-Nino-20-G2]
MNYTSSDAPSSKCSVCVLGQFCLPVGISSSDIAKIDTLVKERVHLQKGESLYRHGELLNAVYSVRFGTFKTEYCLEDGRQQVIGFHLPGEILGLDGIGDGHYQSDAIALEESEVCIIRYEAFEDLARQIPVLQQQFHRILSRELTQDQRHLLSLGSLRAEERLAAFLLNLSQRLAARGYLNNEFDLRMSRVEIGSYLGIQIETVSRMLSRFAESGLIQIKQRHIKLIDMDGLYELASIPNPDRTVQIKSAGA